MKEWVGEASVCNFEIVPQPSERLCSQEPSWSIGEHCMLTWLGVRYRSLRKSKWKFRLKRAGSSFGFHLSQLNPDPGLLEAPPWRPANLCPGVMLFPRFWVFPLSSLSLSRLAAEAALAMAEEGEAARRSLRRLSRPRETSVLANRARPIRSRYPTQATEQPVGL